MKVGITADLHLGKKDAHPERYSALENILRIIQGVGIENLIIAGDLFDNDFNDYSGFERLCRAYPAIGFHIIPGNHDSNISVRSIVGNKIHIYDEPSVEDIGGSTFLFVPYEVRKSMGEVVTGMKEVLSGKEWILVGHGDYYEGVKEPNPLEPGTYMPLSRENVQAFNPRKVFLGHIHKPLDRQKVCYTGSPCGLDISETGRRSFLIYDTESGEVNRKFVNTEVLFFEEKFIVVPFEDEINVLREEIGRRIDAWDITQEEYPKIKVRVSASGFSLDRSAVLVALEEGFNGFGYYDGRPEIDNLYTSSDPQLDTIANRVLGLIDTLEYPLGGDGPDTDAVKMEALKLIYGN